MSSHTARGIAAPQLKPTLRCAAARLPPVAAPMKVQDVVQRAVLASVVSVALLSGTPDARAAGLESIELPDIAKSEWTLGANARSKKILADAEADFQNSDLLSILKDNTEENKDKNKKAITNKYCKRQAEMGVGDCGGLRFIPGATDNGKQRTPDWLAKIFGLEPQPEVPRLNLFGDE